MSETKTKYTPAEAIKAVDGLHKKLIYQMMNDSPRQLNYELVQEPGRKQPRRMIDGSELARVFGDRFHPAETSETILRNQSKLKETSETNGNRPENNGLAATIQVLEERLQHKDELLKERERTIGELRDGRDEERREKQRLLGIIENQTRLLTHTSEQKDPSNEPKRSWWKLW